MYKHISEIDPEITQAIQAERQRQREGLELIPSENFVSRAVLQATGSVLTNKYAEGLPGKRYYGGCEKVDIAENLARDRAKQLFGCDHVNVQPHSGSQANMSVFMAMLDPGDRFMGMELSHGGHMTHGLSINFSGKLYENFPYQVNKETELIDYDALQKKAEMVKPKMIIAGASAYPRIIDFKRFKEIADSVGAYLMADIAHIAGLIVAGLHPSPIPYADFVTTTTHKTLRGPRGGLVMCKEEFAKKIDKSILPGIQGGPLMHVIAAKAVCFKEAMEPEFKSYQEQIVKNCKVLADELINQGLRLVSGGTDNHLVLVDVIPKGITGKEAEQALEKAGITVNKNMIPFDDKPPLVTSGIRFGTPAITTRGMKEEEMKKIGNWISMVLNSPKDEELLERIRSDVKEFCDKFPLYQ